MWGQFNMPIIQMIHVITIAQVTIVYLEKKHILLINAATTLTSFE